MEMDTPEKTHISTPLSKIEDSPVFRYINSLSPIKPVKSVHIQTFQSLSFASLPSIFTSPYLSSHKDSRFLRRNSNSDLSRPEFYSANGNKISSNAGVAADADQLYDNSAELEGKFDSGAIVEAAVENSSDYLKSAIEKPRNLKYDSGSPDCESTPPRGTWTESVLESAATSALPVSFLNEVSESSSLGGELHLQRIYQIDRKKEATECDWDNLTSDASDLLIFTSPMETEPFKGLIQESLDPDTGFCTSLEELHKVQIVDSGKQYEMEEPSTQPRETIDPNNNKNKNFTTNLSEEADNEARTSIVFSYKHISNLHRGMRRRCLDFEMVGARRKNGDDCSSSSSSILVQSDEKIGSIGKQLVPLKPGSDSLRCRLPGIGLHLNALAITSKDSNKVKHDAFSSDISFPSSDAAFHSPTTGQELDESLALVPVERHMDPSENGSPLEKDVSLATECLISEEFNQNSPKKRRRKLDGEGEACKRCNCKKSKCLKLYCECFAAGIYCIDSCSCQDCFNKPIHEDTVLATRKQIESRNPLAFAPKVIRSKESVPEIGDESSKTPASARHKRGCNCKKSSCLKKYCECYQGGVGCSINCRCEGCKNAFGRKDGSAPLETEAESADESETEACKKAEVGKISQQNEIINNEEQNSSAALPTTPLQLSRPLLQLPFSSKNKPPRSFLGIGSSSGLYTREIYEKPNIIWPPQSKFEKQCQTVLNNDTPEILGCNYSPATGIKSSSPNSKRVSPPLTNLGSSPGLRSGRKLILQSIPSFPSLTPQH